MSVLSHQSAINPNSNFWARAIPSINSSTISVNKLNANEISTGYLYVDVLFGDEATISSISTNAIELDGAYLNTVNGTEVLLNGVPIATTANLSSIADWAIYPATSSIMNTSPLNDVGSQIMPFRGGFFSTLFAQNAIIQSTTTTLTETLSSQFVNVVQASTINTDVLHTESLLFSTANGEVMNAQVGVFSTLIASTFTSINSQIINVSTFSGGSASFSSIDALTGRISSFSTSILQVEGDAIDNPRGGIFSWRGTFGQLSTTTLRVQSDARIGILSNNYINSALIDVSTLNVRRVESVSTLRAENISVSTLNTNNLLNIITLGGRNATFSTINASNVYVPGQLYGNDVRGNQGTFSNFINVGYYSNILSNGYNANINSAGNLTTNGTVTCGNITGDNVDCDDIDALDIVCCNVTVGSPAIGLADVEIYGSTALPFDSALYVEGGVEFQGGLIHGFSAGALPVAGINTQRFSLTPLGITMISPTFITIDSGATANIATGGAFSLAVGGVANLAAGTYMEIDTGNLKLINNTPIIFSANSGTGAPGGVNINTYTQSNSLAFNGLPFGALDKYASSATFTVSSGTMHQFLESIPLPEIGQWYIKTSFEIIKQGGGSANSTDAALYFSPTPNPPISAFNQAIFAAPMYAMPSSQYLTVNAPVVISTITGYTSTINSTITQNFSTFFSTGQTFSTFTSSFYSTIVAEGGLNLYFDGSQSQNNFTATIQRGSFLASYLGQYIPPA